jgi:hypothetical protein
VPGAERQPPQARRRLVEGHEALAGDGGGGGDGAS